MSILSRGSKDKSEYQGEEHWISISDLMSALMMIFLLLAVFYMIYWTEAKRLEEVEQEKFLVTAGDLTAQVAIYETAIEEKDKLLATATDEYKALFSKAGDLEAQLAGSDKLLAEKEKLLAAATDEYKALFSKGGELEAQLAGSDKLLAEKEKLLAAATDEYKALFSKAGELEAQLAGSNKLLAEKEKLLATATDEYKALFAKGGELEAQLAGSDKLLAEKEKLLAAATDEYKALFAKGGELEAQLAGSNKLLAEKDKLLATATDEYKALFSKAGELEAQLAGSDKLLAEKEKLLAAATEEYKALFAKGGELEALLAGSDKLLAEKDKLLAENAIRLENAFIEADIKTDKFNKYVSQVVIYEDVIKELRQSLLGEFNPDLKKWNAELRDDLTFRFNEPTVLFDVGDIAIKPRFQRILDDFFPRYIKVITSDKFRKDIAEVRIEGHTSSFWGDLDPNSHEAYYHNMGLSQGRSRNTLNYVIQLPIAKKHISWLRGRLTANGLSSSKLVDRNGYLLSDPRSNGIERSSRSQRVEFRVRIDAESKITKLINSGKESEKLEIGN